MNEQVTNHLDFATIYRIAAHDIITTTTHYSCTTYTHTGQMQKKKKMEITFFVPSKPFLVQSVKTRSVYAPNS